MLLWAIPSLDFEPSVSPPSTLEPMGLGRAAPCERKHAPHEYHSNARYDRRHREKAD